jgi:hypothetical protein
MRMICKKEISLSPLRFNFAVEYVSRRVEVNLEGLKLNGTHWLLVYAENVYLICGSVHTIKKTQNIYYLLVRRPAKK